jgi:hypothetical protein
MKNKGLKLLLPILCILCIGGMAQRLPKDQTYYSKFSGYLFGDAIRRYGFGVDYSPSLRFDVDLRFSLFYPNPGLSRKILAGDYFAYSGYGVSLQPKFFASGRGKGFYWGAVLGYSRLWYQDKVINYNIAYQKKTTSLITLPSPTLIGFKSNGPYIGLEFFAGAAPVRQVSHSTYYLKTQTYYPQYTVLNQGPYSSDALDPSIDYLVDITAGIKISFGIKKRKAYKLKSYYFNYLMQELSSPSTTGPGIFKDKKEYLYYKKGVRYYFNRYWKDEEYMMKCMRTLADEYKAAHPPK